MSTGVVVAIAVGWSVMSLGMALLIVRGLVQSIWNGLAAAHPAVEPAPDAVRRRFQSFRMGMFNLGYSVHVAADERFLHLFPAAIIRWAGARPMSVAWEAIEPTGARLGGSMRARVGRLVVWGPAWCMRLAAADAATPGGGPPRR